MDGKAKPEPYRIIKYGNIEAVMPDLLAGKFSNIKSRLEAQADYFVRLYNKSLGDKMRFVQKIQKENLPWWSTSEPEVKS